MALASTEVPKTGHLSRSEVGGERAGPGFFLRKAKLLVIGDGQGTFK